LLVEVTHRERDADRELLIKTARELESKLSALESAKRKNEDRLQNQEEKNRLLAQELSNLADKFKARESELSKSNLDLQRTVQNLSKSNELTQLEVAKQKDSLSSEFKIMIDQLSSQLEKQKEIVQKLSSQLKTTEGNYKQTLGELGEANRQLKALQALNETLKENLQTDETEVGNLRSKIAYLENSLSDKDLKIKSLTLENRNMSSEGDKLKKAQDRSIQQVESLLQLESQNKDLIKSLKTELLSQKDAFEILKKQFESNKVDNTRLSDSSNRLKSTIEKKDKEIEELKLLQRSLNDQVKDLGRQRNNDKNSGEPTDKRLIDLEEANFRLRESEGYAKKRLEDARLRIQDYETTLRNLEDDYRARIREKDKQVKALTAQVGKLKAEWVTDIRKKDIESTQDIGELRRNYENTIHDMKQNIANLQEEHLGTLNKTIETHSKQLEQELAEHQEKMIELKSNHKATVEVLTAKIEALIDRFSSDPSLKAGMNELEQIYKLKYDQERANLEEMYENKIDKLLAEVAEQQRRLGYAHREGLRLAEHCADLRQLWADDSSRSASRRSSVQSLNHDPDAVAEGLRLPLRASLRGHSRPDSATARGGGRIRPGGDRQVSDADRGSLTDRENKQRIKNGHPGAEGFNESPENRQASDPRLLGRKSLVQRGGFSEGQTGAEKSYQLTPQKNFDISNFHAEENQEGSYQKEDAFSSEYMDDFESPSNIKASSTSKEGIQSSDDPLKYQLDSPSDRRKILLEKIEENFVSSRAYRDDKRHREHKEDDVSSNRLKISKDGYSHDEETRINQRQFSNDNKPSYDQRGLLALKGSSWSVKEKPQYLQTLTMLRKARILNNALTHIMSSHKLKAFHSVLQANIRRLRGWGEAGTRVKGRLLYLLKSRYSDVGVRRSFLKWAMISKPDFLRNCVTKLALTSRLDEHTVFWRFRKVIEKRLRNRIPESAKTSRYMLGSFMVHYLFKKAQTVRKMETMNWIRPKIIGKSTQILARILIISTTKTYLKKLKALSKLRYFSSKTSLVLNSVKSAYESRTISAFNILKSCLIAQKQTEKEADLAKDNLLMVQALKSAVKRSIETFVKKEFLHEKEERVHIIGKLLKSTNIGLQSQALTMLRDHERTQKAGLTNKSRATTRLVNSWKAKTSQDLKASFDRLAWQTRHSAQESAIARLGAESQATRRAAVLRAAGRKLMQAQAAKLRAGSTVLAEHWLSGLAAEFRALAMQTRRGNTQARLVAKAVLAFRLKASAAFSRLCEHSSAVRNSQAFKQKLLTRALFVLTHASSAKTGATLALLRACNGEVAARELKQRDLQRRVASLKAKIVGILAISSKGKLAQSFKYLHDFHKREQEKQSKRLNKANLMLVKFVNASQTKQRLVLGSLKEILLQDIVKINQFELNDQKKLLIRLKILGKLVGEHKNKVRECLSRLIDHNSIIKQAKLQENRHFIKIGSRITKANKGKVRAAFENLTDNHHAIVDAHDTLKAQEAMRKVLLLRIIRSSVKANLKKMEIALSRLEKFKNFGLFKTINMTKLQKTLINKLDSCFESKSRIALNCLVFNKLEGLEKEMKKNSLKSKKMSLVKAFSNRLGWNACKMVEDTFKKLRLNNADISFMDYRKSKARNTLVLKLGHSLTGKLSGILSRLRQQNETEKANLKAVQLFKTSLTNRIGISLYQKMRIAYSRLLSNMKNSFNQESIRIRRVERELQGLMNSQNTKLRIALNIILQHSIANLAQNTLSSIQKKREEGITHKILLKLGRNSEQKQAQAFQVLAINKLSQNNLSEGKSIRMKLMLGKLSSSCSGKQARALEILEENYYSKSSGASRKYLGLVYFLNRLDLKQRGAFSKLLQNNEILKNRTGILERKTNTILTQISLKLVQNCQNNLRKTIQHLGNHAQIQKKLQEHKLKIFSQLGASIKQKIKESMFQLKNYHIFCLGESKLSITLLENKFERELHLKRRLFKRLTTAMKQSCAKVIRTLKHINSDYKDLKNREVHAIRTVLSQLALSEAYNKRFIVNKMKSHSRVLKEYREYLNKMCSKIFGKLTSARTNVLYQAYITMMKHKISSEQKVNVVRNQLNALFISLGKAQTNKSKNCLIIAKKFITDLQTQKRKEVQSTHRIAHAILRGETGKLEEAFASLKRLNIQKGNETMVRTLASKRLIRGINGAQQLKIAEVFGKLAQHKSYDDNTGLKKALFCKLIARHLLGNYRKIVSKTLDKLLLFNSQKLNSISLKKQKGYILASKMVNALENKLQRSFLGLLNDIEASKRKALRETYIKRRTIDKLSANYRTLCSSGYFKLKEINLRESGSTSRKQTKLSHLINRLLSASDAKKRASLDSLYMFMNNERSQGNLKRRTIQRLVRNLEGMEKVVLNRLQAHQLIGQLQRKTQRLKLSSIVSKSQSNIIKEAYKRLVKNSKDRSRLSRIIEKFDSRLRSQSLQTALNKCRMLTGMEKKKSVTYRLINLFGRVQEDLIAAKKLAFNKWKVHSNEPKTKAKILSSVLNKLVQTRQAYAVQKIKYRSEVTGIDMRKQAIRRLLLGVITLISKRRNSTFVDMKLAFHSDNKWFKKVIFTWTQQSKLNAQKAFWRIKDQKILGISSVQTNKAVKLRSFVSLLHQKQLKTMASVFSGIQYSSAFKSWHISQLNSYGNSQTKFENEDQALKKTDESPNTDGNEETPLPVTLAKSVLLPHNKP
jgi:hypothetical protein